MGQHSVGFHRLLPLRLGKGREEDVPQLASCMRARQSVPCSKQQVGDKHKNWVTASIILGRQGEAAPQKQAELFVVSLSRSHLHVVQHNILTYQTDRRTHP